MDSIVQNLTNAIVDELDLDQKDSIHSVDLLKKAIASRVQELLVSDPSLLFSYLYRLDVSEAKLKEALNPTEGDIIEAITDLIFDRQLQRVKTKSQYRQAEIDGWEW